MFTNVYMLICFVKISLAWASQYKNRQIHTSSESYPMLFVPKICYKESQSAIFKELRRFCQPSHFLVKLSQSQFFIFCCTIVTQSRDRTSMAKCYCLNHARPNPKAQTHISVAFHILAFYPRHSDRIPSCPALITCLLIVYKGLIFYRGYLLAPAVPTKPKRISG